jgi:hypothetical protein
MTIDERLEALTQSVELLALRQADAEERHEREMADIRREAAATRADFRRAFAMGVREMRNERRRRQELADTQRERMEHLQKLVDRVAAAQLVTEEKLQRFIDSMRRGGNGNP